MLEQQILKEALTLAPKNRANQWGQTRLIFIDFYAQFEEKLRGYAMAVH